jgi:hypothetical protein
MCEKLLIRSVHLCEVVHASEEDIDLDDFVEGGTSFFKDGRKVVDAEFGHLGYGGGWLSEDLAGGRAGNLAGAVDCLGCGNGLGL